MCIGSHAPSRKRQENVRFTGHCRIVCPQFGTALCHPSDDWDLDVAPRFLENLWAPITYESYLVKSVNYELFYKFLRPLFYFLRVTSTRSLHILFWNTVSL